MISDTTTSARYIVTNGVLGYSIPFRIYTEADVAVFWSADARADTKLTLGTQYTVTIMSEGGTVNLLSGVVPVGAILAVVSNVPATQEADFSSTSTVNTEALERQLDRQVQMIQQLDDSVARSVILPATSSETPQDVLDDVFAARDRAETAAASATASQTAAAASATKSAAHSLLAEQSRGQACQCADRAEEARDVAIQQTAAINVVMATEAEKINTIIATNKDDQAAAITASRAWSETDEDVPVDTNAEGNPEYSSKHWALKSSQLLAGNASKTHKGVMQVGSGLDVSEGIVSAKVATTTERGIGRVATAADMKPGATIENGPAFLSAAHSFGIEQSWHDELANRTHGVWYTNTTGKMMIVNIRRAYSSVNEGVVSLNLRNPEGSAFNNMEQSVFGQQNSVSLMNAMYAFVPHGWSYQWVRNSGNTTSVPSTWYEYK